MCRCHENGPKLKRMKSDLVFQLQVQEFVELIKADAISEALAHAREMLVPFAEDHFDCFKRVVVLLVFGKGTKCERYRHFLNEGRWSDLCTQFLSELLRANNLSPVPLLELQLQVRAPILSPVPCYHCNCKFVLSAK
jgi:macrophage erythroblast attacher